jgi:pantoate--beta-alanine ligase
MISSAREMQLVSRQLRKAGKHIGFVPTMGYLHEAHLQLMREAKRKNDVLVVSIFVNPTQFGPNEDFETYPRDLNRDSSKALEVGVDYLFCPSEQEMYPEGYSTYVNVERLTDVMCGRYRPGHFRGVATVVLKLFNIVRPSQAFFGQKDYQQFLVIRRMAADLNLYIEVVPLPIVREEDGLAMSSRNIHLTPEERAIAPNIYRALTAAGRLAEEQGEEDPRRILQEARSILDAYPQLRVEYLDLRDADNLEELERFDRPAVLATAVHLGKVRLIDNVLLQPPTAETTEHAEG